MGNTVAGDKITKSAKLAQHSGTKQNPSLNTSSGVDFHQRIVGSPWHAGDIGIGPILGLQGKKLTNTSHPSVGMESFRQKTTVERTPVVQVHQTPSEQVLPPGPVDHTVDFTGLRGEISASRPVFGRGGGIGTGTGHGGQSSFGGGNGLASGDFRDIYAQRKSLKGWVRHGGVDPAGGEELTQAVPPYYEDIGRPYGKVPLRQSYPKKIGNTSAQGFFG